MKLEGVLVATTTPFRAGQLDLETLKRHLVFLADSGVNGFVPCGTTGESPTLTRDERRAVIGTTREVARTRGLSVVAGCGGNSTAGVLELLKEAEELGVDGTLVVTPYYNKPTPAGLVAHYETLADQARTPLILYHVPGRTGVSLPLDTVARLFRHPHIGGIKEASGQHAYWLGLAALAKETGKTIFAGDDDAYATIQALGGRGIISASANAVPAAFARLHRLMTDGDWAAAFDLQVRLAPLVRAFFSETSPGPLKFALKKYRGETGELRLPLVPVGEATENLVAREWDRFQNSEPRA